MSTPERGDEQHVPALADNRCGELVQGLLEPLLGALSRPAGEQFDVVVAQALAAGRITPELARELRFWQRAAVHEVSDHVRTVLPAVLPVAMAAVALATTEAGAATAAARDAWQTRSAPVPAREATAEDSQDSQDSQDGSGRSGDEGSSTSTVRQAEPSAEDARETPAGDANNADERRDAQDAEETEDTEQGLPPHDGAAMNPHVRRRLFVAGLTSTA